MTSSADVKSCCAAVYSSEAVHWLLGETLHPGGAELTERLARALGIGAGDLVVDIGSGLGTSALVIARATGCAVVGVDLASANVERARTRATEAGLAHRVRFVCGDAEALPLADESVGGALSECSFCLVPDKLKAAAELRRVLRPGARLALADVTARSADLPEELCTLDGWTACLAGARPLEELASLLEDAGLSVDDAENHDTSLVELVDKVEGRLRLASVVGARLPEGLREGAARGLELVAALQRALDAGLVGYGAVYASRR
jgi:SAM-dependent methyltransferase